MTPLAIAFTPNYFVPAATMLKSLLDSSSDADSYRVICLVTEDIPDRMKRQWVDFTRKSLISFILHNGKADGQLPYCS